MLDDKATDDDEAKFCKDLKRLSTRAVSAPMQMQMPSTNVECIDSGDPDHDGEPYVTVKANEAELRAVLPKHNG